MDMMTNGRRRGSVNPHPSGSGAVVEDSLLLMICIDDDGLTTSSTSGAISLFSSSLIVVMVIDGMCDLCVGMKKCLCIETSVIWWYRTTML